jgi:signal transduction histidine kinase/ActR/RegA family two-component response regulator
MHSHRGPLGAPELAELLTLQRDEIVARFVAEVQRKDLPPRGVSRSLLIDHIPRFLDEILAEVSRAKGVRMSQDAVDTSETARRHGEQRWNLGYDLEALIREYGVLRHCIVETAKAAGAQFSIDDFEVLAKCLSVGVAQAATEYIKFRDEQINSQRARVEFLAEAGQLLSSSLDYRSTLSRLTALVVPRLADCCVVHLEGHGTDDMPIAHVNPAKVEIARELYRRFPLPPDSPDGVRTALRTGEPQLMREVDPELLTTLAHNPEHLALLQRFDARSWMIIPLQVQQHLFGALLLSYNESDRRYSGEDFVLATDLARRAAVAIDNARLYELSQQERSRVESATRAKDEFVAVVSHELRSPLNAMLGWARLLRRGGLTEEKRQHALEIIERNANAQNRLIGDLLDVSRILTGKLRINASQMDLTNVVEMAIEAIRPAADAKRIQLEADLERANAVMRGDGDRLQQVVLNLLVNAIKFTPKGGRISVRLRRVESDLQLIVEDNGEGIPESFLPHVFDSFRQSDASASRGHGGLGIGLSIARHIIELHGGSIEAHSAGLGKGSTFLVSLPISPLVSATLGISRVPATKQQDAAALPPGGLNGIRVLVVDDEQDARELVAYVLETCGAEVRMAGSTGEAMAAIEEYSPQVIVSDIGMPDEDGYALIRSVRTLPSESKRNIPAIALTAFTRNEDRTRALIEGFNVHMAKPIEPTALVQAVIDLAGQPTATNPLRPST